MKNKFFSFTGLLIAALLLNETQCQQNSATQNAAAPGKSGSVLPMAVGNQWIYNDSVFLQGKINEIVFDTLTILKTGNQNGKTTFIFSDGKELSQSGDTIFQWVSQRSGMRFPTTLFIKSENELSYNYMFGGDVIMERTVSKMKSCDSKIKEAVNCYVVKDRCNAETIFSEGIGIVRERTTDCFGGEKSYTIRTLIKFLPAKK